MTTLLTNLNKITTNTANFLLSQQVVARDLVLTIGKEGSASTNIKLIAGHNSTVNLLVKTKDQALELTTNESTISLKIGEFFRMTLTGKLHTVPDFYGLTPQHKGTTKKINVDEGSPPANNKLRNTIIRTLQLMPQLFNSLKSFRDIVFPEQPVDFTMIEGVTFRLVSIVKTDRTIVKIESYDEGGIYDFHLNAEGLTYPPQVAGNYYADAYSALLFTLLYQKKQNTKWKHASEASLRFLTRIYPQYKPASIAWHHSDFKNAALLTLYEKTQNKNLKEQWQDFSNLVEDHYEPTNVYALRYHWRTLLGTLTDDQKQFELSERCLERLTQDQTEEGLFHDNVDVYPDAHDLTYHQYSTVCIGLGLEAAESIKARKLFSNAVSFSLNALTPTGEPAYVGRAANNIHHSASAILSFALAAKYENNLFKKGQYIRAIRLVSDRLSQFQGADGMLPTAMNSFTKKRMAWNHCETPYNAFVGALLMLSSHELETLISIKEQPIPMELENITIANDAGFAFISNSNLYLSIFGGCTQSYPWSEGRHITGVGGVAHFGYGKMKEGLTPTLSLASPSKITLSDLPVINGESAFGRANLSAISDKLGIRYCHEYGGATIVRLYIIIDSHVVILTKIKSTSGHLLNVEGMAAWPVRDSDKWSHFQSKNNQYVLKNPDGKELFISFSLTSNNAANKLNVISSKRVSNAKGYAKRVSFHKTVSGKELTSQLILSQSEKIPYNQIPKSVNLSALFKEMDDFL